MMNKAIKLLVFAGALLSLGALAQANQTWKFGFPTYAYIYTDTAEVHFDFTLDASSLPPSGTDATKLTAFDAASLDALETCIDDLIANISGDLIADDSPANDLGSCYFAPSGVAHDGYSVDWSGVDSQGTDGSLIVVTNSSTYSVDVSVDAPPSSVGFMLAVDTAGNISDENDFDVTFTSASTSQSGLANQDSDYTTQYRRVYVIPLSYAVEITPDVAAQNLTDYDMTYTISAP